MSKIIFHAPEAQRRITSLRGVIWDMDGTLYRSEAVLSHAIDIAVARAAVDMGVGLSYEEALVLSVRSGRECHYSGRVFVEHHGLDEEMLHQAYHRLVDEAVIQKSEDVAALFSQISLPHALVTHSSRDWVKRVLAHLGVKKYFPDENIFALEDVEFRRKYEGPYSFERALEKLGAPAAEVLVVEDLPGNLKPAHEMGMMTALVHHGRKPEATPDFIDITADNAGDILRAIKGI